jgi:protein-tyrosine phosphatase
LPRALAGATGRPLIQTSCNRTGEPPAVDGAGVVDILGEEVDLLLDAGRSPGGDSSTVVVCDEVSFSVVRKGAMPTARIIRAATDLVLVVCTGNLCRSPLAEALLRSEVAGRLGCEPEEVVRHGWRFASFGTTAPSGEPATEHTLTVAQEMGLDLSGHRSCPFRISRVREATRLFGATRQHIDFLLPYVHDRPEALDLLHPEGKDIPDPYSRSLKVYRRSAELIRVACEKRAAELIPLGESGE